MVRRRRKASRAIDAPRRRLGGRLFGRTADAFSQRLRDVTLDPRYVEAIGGRASANDLRRTCAQWLRARGATPDLIAPVLGHTTDKLAQQVYARPAHERLAALLQRAVEGPARPRRRVQRLVRRVQRRRSGQAGQSPSPTDKTDATDE